MCHPLIRGHHIVQTITNLPVSQWIRNCAHFSKPLDPHMREGTLKTHQGWNLTMQTARRSVIGTSCFSWWKKFMESSLNDERTSSSCQASGSCLYNYLKWVLQEDLLTKKSWASWGFLCDFPSFFPFSHVNKSTKIRAHSISYLKMALQFCIWVWSLSCRLRCPLVYAIPAPTILNTVSALAISASTTPPYWPQISDLGSWSRRELHPILAAYPRTSILQSQDTSSPTFFLSTSTSL
jgi:hypothetical protein